MRSFQELVINNYLDLEIKKATLNDKSTIISRKFCSEYLAYLHIELKLDLPLCLSNSFGYRTEV